MTVIPFRLKRAPRIILDAGVVVRSDDYPPGSTVFRLDYQDGEGGFLTVWDGMSYEAGRAAAREWQSDGIPLIDRVAK